MAFRKDQFVLEFDDGHLAASAAARCWMPQKEIYVDWPGRGFHHVWENKFELKEGGYAVVAYAVGGANNGYRGTFVFLYDADGEPNRVAYEFGNFHLPLKCVGEKLSRWRGPNPFVKAERMPMRYPHELPGFKGDDLEYPWATHKDGWFTKSPAAIYKELISPIFHEDDRAWVMNEGVYIYFHDGSYRMVPRWAFAFLDRMPYPRARQGDLLVLQPSAVERYWPIIEEEEVHGYCKLSIDRHTAVNLEQPYKKITFMRGRFLGEPAEIVGYLVHAQTGKDIVLEHPEHGVLNTREYEALLVLMPGTSRPYENVKERD